MAQLATADDAPARAPARPRSDRADLARQNFNRYWYCKERGHLTYCEKAKRLEEMYIGGGLQWLPEDRAFMEGEEGRKCIELNEIADAINTALGYQVGNRVDIAFKPRGQGATEQIATALSQVSMQIADNVKFQWHETQVFTDGLIQQRGYYETRLNFDDSMNGEIGLWTLDPLDVIPDPDAKSYDPDDWSDVTITRWLTFDEIEAMYGTKARRLVEQRGPILADRDYGWDVDEVPRNKFGDEEDWSYDRSYDAFFDEAGVSRVRIIDRQYWKMTSTRVVVYPTGDIRVAATATPAKLAYWRAQGCIIMQRPVKRVRWTVSAGCDVLLHDDWSPYQHFSVIPYFPFFRRGKTKGAVDDLVGPQELLNKALSQYLHIVNTTANSGWAVEQNSLTNMTTEELEDHGARTGVVLEYRKGATKPEKIKPNEVPGGIAQLVQMGSEKITKISGQNDAMRGKGGANQSGVAVQSLQFSAQMSLAIPLDNLTRTRHMLAQRWLEMIQQFYDEPRIWRITQAMPNGKKQTVELQTNWPQPDTAELLNNLTLGEYEVVITEQPAQITYENSQFNQAMDMRKLGLSIPDDVVLRYSNLADKAEIIDRMQAEPKGNPVDEAKAALAQAQATLAAANATAKNVEALFSAIRTAQIITQMPAVSPIADTIAKSAGFKDADAAPIFAQPGQAETAAATGVAPPPTNTHPATPDNPERGMDTGIEAGPAAQPA